MGSIVPLFIAIMLALFFFTCLISYYCEGETLVLYLFRAMISSYPQSSYRNYRFVMPILIFIWANIDSVWLGIFSDLTRLGSTWINMLVVLLLSPKVFALYKDYEEQMKAKERPVLQPG